MLVGTPKNEPAVLITAFEGYGDLVYHTPTIRALNKFYKNLDVWCKNPEPFFHNPYIRKLSVFDRTIPEPFDFYGPHVFTVTMDSLTRFPHCGIHTTDLVSLKSLRRILRDEEKTLDAFWTTEDYNHVNNIIDSLPSKGHDFFVVISPAKTWASRTLPLDFYKKLIAGIQATGNHVILVGKDINYKSGVDIDKTLYDSKHFPNTTCLYNQLTFAQLCALYSITPVAINTENGNNPISCTNNTCWNIYIPTLTAPEYRLPFRCGSQKYRTAVAANDHDYFPASVYGDTDTDSYLTMPIELPSVEKVLAIYKSVLNCIKDNRNVL